MFPLVSLMSTAEVLRRNFAQLMNDKSTASLPEPVMSMTDFKDFIGFPEVEALQTKYLIHELPAAE